MHYKTILSIALLVVISGGLVWAHDAGVFVTAPASFGADVSRIALVSPLQIQSSGNIFKNLFTAPFNAKIAIPVTKTLTGTFLHTHFDDFENGKEIPIYQLETNSGTISLNLGDTPKSSLPKSGSRVEISGIEQQGQIRIASANDLKKIADPSNITQKDVQLTTGPRKLSIVLYKFANTTATPPFTQEDVRKNFFEPNPETGLTMSNFLELSTYGKFSLEGKTSVDGTTDVYGWYTVSMNRSGCGWGQYTRAGSMAINIAKQNGLVIGPDDIVAVGTFPEECPTGGAPGGNTVMMRNMMSWDNTLHEFGHLAGAYEHSNSLECKDSLGSIVPFWESGSQCVQLGYGSPYSIVGGSVSGALKPRLLDLKNRMRAHLFISNNIVTVGKNGGFFEITKVNYPTAQLLRLPIDEHPMYINGIKYLNNTTSIGLEFEARDFLPFEQDVDTSPHENVVLVRWQGDLVNPTYKPNKLLAPNESFTFNGFTIKNHGRSPLDNKKVRIEIKPESGATLDINPSYLNFTPPNPSIVYVNSQGVLLQQPIFSGTLPSHSAWQFFSLSVGDGGGGVFESANNSKRIYPLAGSTRDYSMLDSKIINFTYSLGPGVNTSVIHNFSYPLLQGLVLSPADLVGKSRFIYQLDFTILPFNDARYLQTFPIYLIYGQFTQQELINLGIWEKINSKSGVIPNSVFNTQLTR